jgi:tripartite-type tricarboxylate transporter receptor subunit TctC
MRKAFLAMLCAVLVFVPVTASGEWKPDKPITCIVPWAAGGSTDQITRVCAGELEGALGQKIVIVNQPGASGSVGTKTVLDAERDGYTWASGAVADLGTYKVMGFLDTTLDDWHLYLSVANVIVISVHPDTPYKDFGSLLAAFREKPGEIPVATAGEVSGGRVGMESLRKYGDFEYKHVPYAGGNPAVVACVSGETPVVCQLACEQVDMIRAKRLRPLAVLDVSPLEVKDYGAIPPVTNWLSDFKSIPFYFGIFIPKGVPNEVISTLDKLWVDIIGNSQVVKDYALDRGAVFDPAVGEKAREKAFALTQTVAWLYYDLGRAKVSPEEVGIPRP